MSFCAINGIKSAIILDGYMYFVPSRFSVLLRVDLLTWEFEEVCDLNFEPRSGLVDVLQDKDEIWCVAMNGIQITRYNLLNGHCETYRWDIEKRTNVAVTCYNGKLWIISKKIFENIICLDMKTLQFSTYDKFAKWCILNGISGEILSLCFNESKIMAITSDVKGVVSFSLEDEEGYLFELNMEGGGFGIRRYGELYYISSRTSKKFLCWSENGNIQAYLGSGDPKDIYKIVIREGSFVIASQTYGIELEKEGYMYPVQIQGMENVYDAGSLYYCAYETNEYIYLPPWNSNMFLIIDKCTGEIKGRKLELPLNRFILYTRDIREKEISIEDFIKNIEYVKTSAKRESCGDVIYEMISESVKRNGLV